MNSWTKPYLKFVLKPITKNGYSYGFNYEYINSSAAVFYFDTEYGISDEELVWDVSDHYPIYANFRTDLTDDD